MEIITECVLSIDPVICAAWINFAAIFSGTLAAILTIFILWFLTTKKIKAERINEKNRIDQQAPVAASMLCGNLAIFMVKCYQMMDKTIFDKAVESDEFPKFEKYDEKLPWKSLDPDIMAEAHAIRSRLICISLNMSMVKERNLYGQDFREDFRKTGNRCVELIYKAKCEYLPDKKLHPMDEGYLDGYKDLFSTPS